MGTLASGIQKILQKTQGAGIWSSKESMQPAGAWMSKRQDQETSGSMGGKAWGHRHWCHRESFLLVE